MVAEDFTLTHQYEYDEDGNIRCKDHPLKTNNPGGICALCLQDKLTKLVSSSSSFPLPVFPSSTSSSPPTASASASPPPFRSHASTAPSLRPPSTHDRSLLNPTRNPFSLSLKNKFKERKNVNKSSGSSCEAVLKRSKSTATRINYFGETNDNQVDTPRRKGFWSFLVKKSDKPRNEICYAPQGLGQNGSSFQQGKREMSYVVVEENDSPDGTSLDRRVSRSRSVGCGSRSFSGDLFERISTGFGDCTLRRVESHREGKTKMGGSGHRSSGLGKDGVKGRVKCGGIFGGLMVASSSSSSSSSSSYRVSSSTEDGKFSVAGHRSSSRSWGWAFASPMRGFSKPPSSAAAAAAKKEVSNSNKNLTPNLNAIPSLLTVGG